MMTDGIAIIVTLILAGGALLALMNWLANIDRKRAEMTEEEYQNQERGPNLIGAGMIGLDEFLRPDMKRAIEYRIDAEQGNLPGGDQQGEQTDTEPSPATTTGYDGGNGSGENDYGGNANGCDQTL